MTDERWAPNPAGHPASLTPGQGTENLRFGHYSPEVREPRARQIAEAIMAEPHTAAVDTLGAVEIGRLEALIETLDTAIEATPRTGRGAGRMTGLLEHRLRASRRLAEWLDRYGMTPKGRADWASKLVETESFHQTATRRREHARLEEERRGT